MDHDIIVMLSDCGNTYPIRLKTSSSYKEFKEKLLENDLNSIHLNNLRFSIPGHSNCVLSNEEHWGNMLMLLKVFNLPVVNLSSTSSSTEDGLHNGFNGKKDSTSRTNPLVDVGWKRSDKELLCASWSKIIHSVGQTFKGGATDFRIELAKYSLEVGFKFTYKRNTSRCVSAECLNKKEHGCTWSISASVSTANGWFNIRKLQNDHSCPLLVQSTKRLSSSLISVLIVDKVRQDPSMSAVDVIDHFDTDYKMVVEYAMAWRALEKARSYIFGNYSESFQELDGYIRRLKHTNPDSYIEMEVDTETKRFKRLFVSFRPSIKGFEHCRPMLFLDGTFLKSRFKGQLLAATGKDGNQGLFPVAFAIVDSESKENWAWFLRHLCVVLYPGRDLIYVSDRNVGLMELFSNEFKHLRHFYCLHHLKDNLKGRYKGKGFTEAYKNKMVGLLSECARAPTLALFETKYAELYEECNPLGRAFLDGLSFERWAYAHSPCVRFGEMTSNSAESYNKAILKARELPITHLVDSLRRKVVKWFDKRNTASAKWKGELCDEMQKKWDDALVEARTWMPRRVTSTIFEYETEPSIVVNLTDRTCSCYEWQFYGFPCSHAIKAISQSEWQAIDFVDPFHFTSTYRKTYEGIIMPAPTMLKYTENIGNEMIIRPPVTKKQPGRPPKKRIASRGEAGRKSRSHRCSRCNKIADHNRATCTVPISG